jgi:hypothetical protein
MRQTADEFRKEALRIQEIKKEMRSEFPDVPFPDVYREGVWIGSDRNDIERKQEWQAICGSFTEDRSDRVDYCIATEEYKILPHEVAAHELRQEIRTQVREYGEPAFDIRMHPDSAVMELVVTFPECDMLIQEGDAVNPQIKLFNSYDKSKRLSTAFGALQQICSNGLMAFRVMKTLGQKHRQNLDVSYIVGELTKGMAKYSDQVGLWKQWAQKELTSSEWDTLWTALPFGDAEEKEDGRERRGYRKQILDLPQTSTGVTIRGLLESKTPINMWTAHSIITQFITHEVPSTERQLMYGREVARAFHNVPLN